MSEPEAPIPPEELKKCPYCGHLTSIHANFCFYCARELVARPERPMEEEKPQPVNWLIIVGVIVVIVLIVAALALTMTVR